MEQSSCSEIKRLSASQGIPHPLLNSHVHYRVHKSASLDIVPSQMNSVEAFTAFLLILSSRLRLGVTSGIFP